MTLELHNSCSLLDPVDDFLQETVTAQVVKTRITLQLATLDHLRAAETEPLRPARRLHMRR
jgi:hypothetical protein